jgi:hypothetical protein
MKTIVSSGGVPIMTEAEKHRLQVESLKKLNNEEFLAHIMMYSPYGALCQVFIIEAIRYYTELIIEQGEPESKPDAFINPLLWHMTAKDILEKYQMKYDRNG